jgi:hypothetical protein
VTTAEQAVPATPDTFDQPSWVTLREASGAVGVSVSALRKAYRAGRLEARDEDGPYGVQKRVRLDEVRAVMGTSSSPSMAAPRTDGRTLVLLEEARRGWDAVAALHQAAQELADARERAGRAEGEARVYAELVEELRARVALLEQARGIAGPAALPTAGAATSTRPSTSTSSYDEPAPARGWFGRRRP